MDERKVTRSTMHGYFRSAAMSLALLTLVDVAYVSAQDVVPAIASTLPAYRSRILGVYDARTGDPVEGADIIDVLSGNSMKTTSTGTVTLLFLPDGGGLVRIRKLGYGVQTQMVSISPADTLPLTLMIEKVTELAGVTVVDSAPHYRSPGLRGFEERRLHAATGSYITEAQMRKEDGRPIGMALLAHIPTLNIMESRGGQAYLLKSPRCGAGGHPAVYLDGVLMTTAPGKPTNLNDFVTSDIATVEYYANTATAPPQFNVTLGSCGALLLWSRER